MCGRKPKYTPPPTPAAPVSAPQEVVKYDVANDKQKHKKAKGKKGLTINASGSGTGVNI